MAGRVRILFKCMNFFMFRHLRDKLLQVYLLIGLYFVYSPFLLSLRLTLFSCLDKLMFLLTFLLYVALHICYFGFNEIEFFMQLEIVLVLYFLHSFLL
jgi:hypothetical protein